IVDGVDHMGWVVAGEGGAAIVAASRLGEPVSALAVEGAAGEAAWRGIPVVPVDGLEGPGGATGVLLVEAEDPTRETVRTWAAAHRLPLVEREPEQVEPPEGVRVLAVSGPGTGVGKTPVVAKLARILRMSGVQVAVLRHPVATLLGWPSLAEVRVVRGTDGLGDGPLDEAEELAPVLAMGAPVVSGTEPEPMLAGAAELAPVVVWDGGGAARPWVRPRMSVVVVDAFKPPTDQAELRIAAADAVVIAKSDTAPPDLVNAWERAIADRNPGASVTLADMPVGVPEGMRLRRRDVAVVEDWSALVLGGHTAGAGAVVARRWACRVIDPRPFAVGAVAEVLRRHPHIGPVVPSMGRTGAEQEDLAETLAAMPAEVVLWASTAAPVPIAGKPVVRAYPEVMEVAGTSLQDVVRPLLPGYD
ncbi:MAG TPA: hypothetical protein VM840_09610, partial [Actinomycetota bacterium]|nr:hypothetical protein [Actinomycetota bacterium]